jgi:perosamine synthetase
MAELLDTGIATRPAVMAIHLTPAYRDARVSLPVTEHATRHGLLLPLYPTMAEEEQDYVVEQFRRVWRG